MILTGMEGIHDTYRHGGDYMILTGMEGTT